MTLASIFMIEILTSEVLSPNTKWDLSSTPIYDLYEPCSRDVFSLCRNFSFDVYSYAAKKYPTHQVVFTVAARSNLVSMFKSFTFYCV